MSIRGLHCGVRGVELVQMWRLDWVMVCVREVRRGEGGLCSGMQ